MWNGKKKTAQLNGITLKIWVKIRYQQKDGKTQTG